MTEPTPVTDEEAQRRELHAEKHEMEQLAVQTALEAERARLEGHRTNHLEAHAAHEQLHQVSESSHRGMHTAEQRALEAATTAMDRRLDSMNEFRDQLRDQASTFVRRADLEALEKQTESRYEELRNLIGTEREERRGNEGQRRGVSQSTAFIVTAIGVVGTILGIVIVAANLMTP